MFLGKSTWQKFFAVLCVASFLATGTGNAQVLVGSQSDTARDLKARNTQGVSSRVSKAFGKPELVGAGRSLGQAVRVGFDQKDIVKVKKKDGTTVDQPRYTNAIAKYDIGPWIRLDSEGRIPDYLVAAVNAKLREYRAEGKIKGIVVQDFAGSDLKIHVTHNYGLYNASVHRLIYNAVIEGLKAAQAKGDYQIADGVDIFALSYEDQIRAFSVRANDDSKLERDAESVAVADFVGADIGAVNIKLLAEFGDLGATPLTMLTGSKARGFRFVVRKVDDILNGNFDGPEFEFEISSAKLDPKTGEILIPSRHEKKELQTLIAQSNDYAVVAVYPVEGGALNPEEPIAQVVFQPVFGSDGKKRNINPSIVYRLQSGAPPVGGTAMSVHDVNFVPGGENGEYFVATRPATLEEARKRPAKGTAHSLYTGYQSYGDGNIPGVLDHVGMNPFFVSHERALALKLARVMADEDEGMGNDQPYLTPLAAEERVHSLRRDQDASFIRAPKESEDDPMLGRFEAQIGSGELVSTTVDKADMGGEWGHTKVPPLFAAIILASLQEAVEQGKITDSGLVGRISKLRVGDIENTGIGDDSYLLLLGDRSKGAQVVHELSFRAFTITYLFASIGDRLGDHKKYYGTAQDYQGVEAKAAIADPFGYSKLTARFFEILAGLIPENEIKLGTLEKVQRKWQEWEGGDKTVTLTRSLQGNVSEQGIGSARYAIKPSVERNFTVIAGDKMGPPAFNRMMKYAAASALNSGKFSNGVVFEIWDLKAFDENGGIAYKDIPVSYEDAKRMEIADKNDKKFSAAELSFFRDVAYQNQSSLNQNLNSSDKAKLDAILKKWGYVPSRRIFLDAERDRDAISTYLADSDRFNIKRMWSKNSPAWNISNPQQFLDRPLAELSVTRLGILTGGEYVGKDDPVIIGNSEFLRFALDFLRDRANIIQGDMNGSHWLWAIVVPKEFAVATKQSAPILSAFKYQVSPDGTRVESVEDLGASSEFDAHRERAAEFNALFTKAQLGGENRPLLTSTDTVEGSYDVKTSVDAMLRDNSPFLVKNKKNKDGSPRKPSGNIMKAVYEKAKDAASLGKKVKLPGLSVEDLSKLSEALESAAISQAPSRVATTQVRGAFGGTPAQQVKIGVILSREVAFDEGGAALLPLLRNAFGSDTPILVMATNETERGIIEAINKDLGPQDQILVSNPNESVHLAAERLREKYNVGQVRYVAAGGAVETAAYRNYGIDVVNVNQSQLDQLAGRMGVDKLQDEIQAIIIASQSA